MARYIKIDITDENISDNKKKQILNSIETKKFYPIAPFKDTFKEETSLRGYLVGYYEIEHDDDIRLFYNSIFNNGEFIILYWRKDLVFSEDIDEDLSEFIEWLDIITDNIEESIGKYNITLIDNIDDINPYLDINRNRITTMLFPEWWPTYYTIKRKEQV